jgi:hypothetical protein
MLIRLMVKEEREVFDVYEKRERGNAVARGYHCMIYLLALQNILDKIVLPFEKSLGCACACKREKDADLIDL